MKKAVWLLGVAFFLPTSALGANLVYQEDFDDRELAQPHLGSTEISADPPDISGTVPAVHGEHYTWDVGRGGTGYCLSGAQNVSVIVLWNISDDWPTDEVYQSVWQRYTNYTKTNDNENFKFFYPHLNNGTYYSFTQYTQGCFYHSAKGADGTMVTVGNYIDAGIDMFDGNWHHYELWAKFSTCQVKLWVDGEQRYQGDYDENICGWSGYVYYLTFGSIDASGQGIYQKQFDDLEVWDGMPDEGSCGDGFCGPDESCTSCLSDCPAGTGEVCCSGDLYQGDCCSDGDCSGSGRCLEHTCQPQEGDVTPPTVIITHPEVDFYTSDTPLIEVSGTTWDNQKVIDVTWACPTCTPSSGTADGTDEWVIADIELSEGAPKEELLTNGDFDTAENWILEEDWIIRDGVASCSGAGANASLSQELDFTQASVYHLEYEISAYESGELWLSQWGFVGEGNGMLLDTSGGTHAVRVVCAFAQGALRLTSVNWIGSIDRLSLREVSGGNEITVMARDAAANTGTDSITVYLAEDTCRAGECQLDEPANAKGGCGCSGSSRSGAGSLPWAVFGLGLAGISRGRRSGLTRGRP